MMGNVKNNNDAEELEFKRYELEKQRFEFEKQSEVSKHNLERDRIHQARWDTFWRFIGSAVITGGIYAAITIYGQNADIAANERAEKANLAAEVRAQARAQQEREEAEDNRKSEILIQLLSARESADTNLRARMFEALLTYYFKEPDNMAKITILEMIGLNFRDAVQVKPMFEQLGQELQDAKGLLALRNAAKTVIADQLDQIRNARDGEVCEYEIIPPQTKPVLPRCFNVLAVKLLDFLEDGSGIKVQVNSKDSVLLGVTDIDKGDIFDVTYFDMPMVDYTSVRKEAGGAWRYSLVLKEISKEGQTAKRAKIAIAVLPIDSYSTQQEYKFDELLADFLAPK